MNLIVAFALKQRLMVLVLLGVFFAAGMAAFHTLNIEAYPDPVPPLVEVVTQSNGQSAQEIERAVTIPIEIQLAGIKNVKAVQTISLFGLSDVRVQFTYDYSYEEAEQKIINALSQLPPLPAGAQPSISPESPIGEIYRYRLVGPPGYSVTDLKTIQDWILERRFKAVPGVVDVNGWAGKSKTYEVTIDQKRLVAYGLSIGQVLSALNNANANVGGQTVNLGPQAAVVRGIGLIHSLDDIRDTMIAGNNGKPVQIKDVATVQVGSAPRLGIVGQDNDNDVVQGVILMRRGEESLPTLQRVEAEVDKLNHEGTLPPGVHLEKIYDRTDLIDITIHTVLENMVIGMVLIFLVQMVFLGNWRSAVIVSATIPFALAFAVIIMVLHGESANLLSIGAIDFGLIVDATVIMVENIFRHLSQPPRDRFHDSVTLDEHGGVQSFFGKLGTIELSAAEVNRAIFFAAAIIIAGFLPLFTLTGVEGHIFGRWHAPMLMEFLAGSLPPSPWHRYCRRCCCATRRKSAKPGWCGRCAGLTIRRCVSRWPIASSRWAAMGALLRGGADRGEQPGARIPAQAGGGQFLDPRDDAAGDQPGGSASSIPTACATS